MQEKTKETLKPTDLMLDSLNNMKNCKRNRNSMSRKKFKKTTISNRNHCIPNSLKKMVVFSLDFFEFLGFYEKTLFFNVF